MYTNWDKKKTEPPYNMQITIRNQFQKLEEKLSNLNIDYEMLAADGSGEKADFHMMKRKYSNVCFVLLSSI